MKKTQSFFLLLLTAGFFTECSPVFDANAQAPDKTLRQIEIYAKQFSWTIRYSGPDNVLGAANYKFVTANNPLGLDSTDVAGYDDVIVTDTFFLPLEKVEISLRSRDVLHSAYFPALNMQMNAVPGMTMDFILQPELTTLAMREERKDTAFDYMFLCNKICGKEHYKMKMKIVVGTQEEFLRWLARHKAFYAGNIPPVKVQEEGDGH